MNSTEAEERARIDAVNKETIDRTREAAYCGIPFRVTFAFLQRRRPQMPPCSPPDPLLALCQGPGQEVICEAGGEVPNFLGFYLRRRRLAQQTRRWRSSFCRMISKKRSRRARI